MNLQPLIERKGVDCEHGAHDLYITGMGLTMHVILKNRDGKNTLRIDILYRAKEGKKSTDRVDDVIILSRSQFLSNHLLHLLIHLI